MIKDLCIRCETSEKRGYKYCNPCKKLEAKERNAHNQKKRRNIPKPCHECKETLTTTKYCKPCAKVVSLRQNKDRSAKMREVWEEKNKGKEILKKAGRKPTIKEEDMNLEPWMTQRNCNYYSGYTTNLGAKHEN